MHVKPFFFNLNILSI